MQIYSNEELSMKHISILFFLILCLSNLSAQNHYNRFESIDIQNYIFEIHLNDSTNRIEGRARIKIKFLKPTQKIQLDFVGKSDSTHTGMEVSKINLNENQLKFTHQNNQLEIDYNKIFNAGELVEIEVEYAGIPADGLIISKNKFGDRTFFGDNWPDRAKNWLPTVDHPSDKATVEFQVYAPEKYQVVSNGIHIEETNFDKGMKYTRWKENVPIPTKLMVIGVAGFAVLSNENFKEVPVSTWVFPQNREQGFSDYSVGDKAIRYFSELIGPFPYEKLAHVQSNTRYGGMENASCIFYSQNSVTGKNQVENLFAHETAHQWFGDAVTEQNWHHVWLSEGFATYLTHLYEEHFFGEEFFKQSMEKDRERVIKFAKRKFAPVIDTTIENYNQLLNANSYQKAGWFLHMLRMETGDSVFFKSLREYYLIFRDSTALTKDFRQIMEKVSDHNLDEFFYQWLYQPGFPQIRIKWGQSGSKVKIEIMQIQPGHIFSFPLELKIESSDGQCVLKKVDINREKHYVEILTPNKIKSVIPDPNTKLLFEEIK